ncbi:MAG: disulfide bond formation protein B [Pseudomonadota bacterium]|nr:disulfide bond formation protein B [Pseudomonadota bacterium]
MATAVEDRFRAPARGRTPALVAGLILVVAAATLAGAWILQLGFGLAPCPLCLVQRWPYYAALPLAAGAAWLGHTGRTRAARAGLGLLALVMLVSAGLGAYHSGVEWGWWAGPTDCAGTGQTTQRATDLLKSLNTVRVVRCDEAAARFLGLSLAGWNALVSLALAVAAAWGLRRA